MIMPSVIMLSVTIKSIMLNVIKLYANIDIVSP
jgi:hypothetical protein